jgi:Fe-S cluster assembly ATPase SufC
MSIENSLLDIFEKTLSKNYPEIPASRMKSLLKQTLEKRKYDTQDEAIIEAILNDKEKPLEESFIESLQRYMNKIESENDFSGTEERQEEIVETFIFDLEKLIDYFYNALLNKHFT